MRVQAAIMEKKDSPEGPYQVGIEDLELEGPRADEVLIRVTSCGVCGTDRHVLHDEMPMNPYPTPSVLGHEGAGIVEAVGEDCTLVEPGDRVVMGFPFCGQCVHCRSGRPIYCLEGEQLRYKGYRLDGSTPFQRLDGSPISGRFFQQSSWSTHTIALERQLAKVPEGVDHDLMGPLGCSISTGAGTVLEELQPRPGTSIAVFGAGAVGLGAIMAAQLTGAVTIIAVDTEPNRLELARELGATHTMVSSDDTIDAVRDLTGGGADYSVEATNRNLMVEAVAVLGVHGVCGAAGASRPTDKMDLYHQDIVEYGKRIVGVLGGGGPAPLNLEYLMNLHARGRFPIDKLIRFYDFADINQAIQDSESGQVVKPVLRMPA